MISALGIDSGRITGCSETDPVPNTASKKCEERAAGKEQTTDNATAVGASRLSGGAMLWFSLTPVTSLEFALTKNASVSALEYALTNSLDLKPPEMNIYRKWGVSPLLPAFCKSWLVNRCSSVFICDYTSCSCLAACCCRPLFQQKCWTSAYNRLSCQSEARMLVWLVYPEARARTRGASICACLSTEVRI